MPPPRGEPAGPRLGPVLALCALAQFMVVLDVSIVNVALPQMRHDLGLTVTGQQWVVNAYTLTFAGFLMLGGRAADLYGRRRVFIAGLVIFTGASLLGGLAQGPAWLITARAVQGLGGAVLAPASLSILTATFTDPLERRRAIGVWSATAASGAASGVLAGGIITDLLNWRWVLFVNVPIGVAMLVASPRALPAFPPAPGQRLDVAGALTITGGLALVVYAIVGTDSHPWGSATTLVPLMAGLALLALSVLVEGRLARYPLVPLGVFRHRAISAANGIAATIGAGLFGMYFFVSLFLQQVEGLSPLQTGVQIVPAGLATLGAALLAPRMVAVLGNRRQLVLGPAVAALGLLWMAQVSPGDSYWSALFGPLVLFGVGIGITFVPMTLAATTGLPPHQAGLASGLVNTTRQMGGALGLAILATVAEHTTAHATGSASAALATGYDRAFLCAGLILLIGAAVAFLIPAATPAPVPVPAQSTAPAPSPLPAQAPAAVAEPGPAAVEPGAAEI